VTLWQRQKLTVADRETILRIDFVVAVLDAVLSSIKTRFSKQATDFMMRILCSHQRFGSVKITKKLEVSQQIITDLKLVWLYSAVQPVH
jgi:hypothetical protein